MIITKRTVELNYEIDEVLIKQPNLSFEVIGLPSNNGLPGAGGYSDALSTF
jgi:hypothetical protein